MLSKSLRTVTVCSLIVGTMCVATTASAQSSSVVFQGLEHRAVGGATVKLNAERDALDVNTFDLAGGDGVAVALGEATSWTARLRAAGSSPLSLSWHAMADGRRISSASMRQVGDRFEVRALFTGATKSTYNAAVYKDGRLVGAVGGVPSTAHIIVPESFCEVFGSIGFIACDIVSNFHNGPNGDCGFGFMFPGEVTIRLPNGVRLAGNELRLVEEVDPAGHYPYLSFDAMVMQTTARTLTLFSESVR
jgi:hypothetical protein